MNVNYNNIISSENQQQIKPGHKAYLLYTVENKYHQSFIGCIATVYADVNNYHSRKIPVPTISKMRTIIAESLTIDMFLKYHNGSLVSTFQPKRYRIEESVLNAHTNSEFYKVRMIDVEVGLFGAKIELGSAKSMINGGIFFTNPAAKPTQKIEIATENDIFNLLKKTE